MSSEPTVSSPLDVTAKPPSTEEVQSPTGTSVEGHFLLDHTYEENHRPNTAPSHDVMRVNDSHSVSSSLISSWHMDELPVPESPLEVSVGSAHHSSDFLNHTGSTMQRHVECPDCIAARHVIYHSCSVKPHEQLTFCEYPLSPVSLATNFNITSLQDGGEGTVTYTAQSPVSVTHIQHSGHTHSSVPFGSQLPLGTAWSPSCQHECSRCTTSLEKQNEIDPYYSAYGEELSQARSRRFSSGADTPRPCPVHGSETFVTSFNSVYDIPIPLKYSNLPGLPYLPRYYIQQPHHHPHSYPVPRHLQGSAYAHHHTGYHHCCSAVFSDGMHDGRCQFPSHYDGKSQMIPDDHHHATASARTSGPTVLCAQHRHEDSRFVMSDHSTASAEGNVLHGPTSEIEHSSDSVADAETAGGVQLPEPYVGAEPVHAGHETCQPEMLTVSSDVPASEEAGNAIPMTEMQRVLSHRDGSSVDGDLMLTNHLKSHSTDIVRSHTPPERDTNSSLEAEKDSAPKAEDDIVHQETPNTRGMAFTIDFGNNLDSPEITEHWKQFTPYRIHAGIQQRASKTKTRMKEKSESLEEAHHQQTEASSNTRGGTKTRSRSPGSRSVGGYVSDSHASGISSDNENASICSEVMGCIQGRRKLMRSSDPRSVLDRSFPSRSQPSLVKGKMASQNARSVSSGGSGHGSAVVKPSRILPSGPQISHKSGTLTKKGVDTKPGVVKMLVSKNDPVKRSVKSAKTASEVTSARRLPKKPDDERDEEILDVTNYLINRMLFSDKTSSGYKTAKRPSSGDAIHTRLPRSAPRLDKDSLRRRHDENIPDNTSETGTYTIEDDALAGEVQKARDEIDVLFGVDTLKPECLIRPVINSTDEASPEQPFAPKVLTQNAVMGEGDVFECEPDVNLQNDYKHQVSEAVSSAISATKAIQKALLQKSSKDHSSSDGGADRTAEPSASSESLPSDVKPSDIHTSSSEPSSTGGHRHVSDVFDERDFGTFTISFDAPPPKPRDSRSCSRDSASISSQDKTMPTDSKSRPLKQTEHVEVEDTRGRSRCASDVQMLMQSVDATVQELHDQLCKKAEDSQFSYIGKAASSHTLQKHSREATFVKEIPLKDADAVSGRVQSATAKPPTSSSGRWRRDYDASDAGSESETGSLSSMDYSTKSSQFTRSTILRSSSGKGAVPTPRVNRTFALRCSKASGSELESTNSIVPRSRSAGTDSRLALCDAGSKSTSHSRTRPQIISPASDVSRSHRVSSASSHSQQNIARRRDLEQQHSEDSSASICSSISSRSSSNFVRKDGGRYSMRTEKSSFRNASTASDRTKERKISKPKSAGSQPSSLAKDRPSSGGSTVSQRQLTAVQTKELNAWKRRKQYDPRKAVAEAKTKGGSCGTSKLESSNQSEPEGDGTMARSFTSYDRHRLDESVRANEIAQLSNAVAYNLNVLAESTQKDSITLDEVQLQQLPVFNCDSNSRSAFSALRFSESHKAHSIPLVASDNITFLEDPEKSSYDSVLVNSIQQVSRKVKVLTDQLINKVREEKRRGASVENLLLSPLSSGAIPTWENASPELASILENLKRTEQHLQVVHKALCTDGSKGRVLESQRHQTAERQRALAERGGFRPIDRPVSGGGTKKRSSGKKQTSLSTNPLSGDEYY